jgi:hypothetical protein
MPADNKNSDLPPSHHYKPSKKHPACNPELRQGCPQVTHMEQNVPRMDLSKLLKMRDEVKAALPLLMPAFSGTEVNW